MVKMDTFSTPGIYSLADLFHCSKSDEKSGNLFDDRLFIGERVNYNAKLFQHPHRMDGVVLLICRKGWLNGSVNLMPHRIEEGMLAVFHREHLLQFWSQSDDFEASAIVLSSQFIQEMHIDLKQAIPIFMHLKDNPAIHITEEEHSVLNMFYETIRCVLRSSDDIHRPAIIQRLLEAMFYKILAIHQNKVPEVSFRCGRREEFFERFMELLTQYHKQERSMGFYAERLHITPKYLSSVIKEVSGKSAAEWIDQYVILEAKALLRYSGLSIQEIAYELNFSTQSFFGKYFKHHTGISPSAYKHK